MELDADLERVLGSVKEGSTELSRSTSNDLAGSVCRYGLRRGAPTPRITAGTVAPMPRTKSAARAAVTPDPDGALAAVRGLVDARAAEVRARDARDAYMEAQFRRGAFIIDIADALEAAADALEVDEHVRRDLGIKEGSVHHALTRRGVKGNR